MLVTVFTPTYNRAHVLSNLYNSLIEQTCVDFEWLIVDDGSTDGTEELVSSWLGKQSFLIRYIKQENGGKHRAVNQGALEAKGELFFIVDSDDVLTEDAISIVKEEYEKVKDCSDYCGVCGLKAYFTGEKVGGEDDFTELECNSLDFRYKYNVKGDVAEVFKTDVIRRYPFPEIQGERFCPEAVVWQRIAQKYKFHYFYKKIYLCDYLQDGLTKKITLIRMQSPVASSICYKELSEARVPFKIKFRAAINYWRFWFCPSYNTKPLIKFLWFWAMPIGFLMHLVDEKRNVR